jgi:Tfp pilus assembly protein PilF
LPPGSQNRSEAYALIGMTQLSLFHMDEAVESLNEVVRREPQNVAEHEKLGRVHVLRSDKAKAMEEYRKLLLLDRKAADWLLDLIQKLK